MAPELLSEKMDSKFCFFLHKNSCILIKVNLLQLYIFFFFQNQLLFFSACFQILSSYNEYFWVNRFSKPVKWFTWHSCHNIWPKFWKGQIKKCCSYSFFPLYLLDTIKCKKIYLFTVCITLVIDYDAAYD